MFTRWLRRRAPATPQRAAPVAELLEPRLLYSADAAGVFATAFSTQMVAPEVRTLDASLEYGASATATQQLTAAQVQQAFPLTALTFEENKGQQPAGVDFAAYGNGYAIALSGGNASIALAGATAPVTLQLVDGHQAGAAGEQLQQARTNDLVGSDQSRWATDIANYASVLYRDVYEGVDVRYYANQRQLEYDFIVGAGADAQQIALRFGGTDSVRIADNGDLLLKVAGSEGELRFQAPVSYQDGAGGREAVASRYRLNADGSIGFELGDYDRSRALVIDPVLTHATYFGATNAENALGVTVGSDGFVYITGRTQSNSDDLAAKAAGAANNQDLYVAKFSANLQQRIWSTRIGGTGDEQSTAIAVDAGGNVWVTGWTKSNNFPVSNGSSISGGQDAFVAELKADGTQLLFGSYFGSAGGGDVGNGIAIDRDGNVVVAGLLSSSGILASDDAFINKYNGSTGAAVWQTTYGGSGDDSANAVAVDAQGGIYVAGVTKSADLPLVGGLLGGVLGANHTDGFLLKLNADGSRSTAVAIGGANDDNALAVAVDTSGKVAVVGQTDNPQGGGFATTGNAFRTTAYAHDTGYLRLYDGTLSTLQYSSFIGGSRNNSNNLDSGLVDQPTGVGFVDGRIVVAGTTTSYDLAITSDGSGHITNNKDAYGFLQFLDTGASGSAALLYGSYYGHKLAAGNVATSGHAAYFVGSTDDTGLATSDGYKTASAGNTDAVVAMFTLPNTAPSLTGSANLQTIVEDTASPAGSRVADLVSGFFSDVDTGTQPGIAITSAGTTGGKWQYATDGSTWVDLPAVSSTSAWLLSGDATTRVRFLPAPNANTSSSIAFRGWDASTGTAATAADASAPGGRSAFSTGLATASINVTSVNDQPVLTNGTVAANVNVVEGSAGTSLGFTGLSYSGGPASATDEQGQALTYTVTGVPLASLGAVKLANGTLVTSGTNYLLSELQGMVFMPATGVNSGSGTFSFNVKDNGGSAGGGVDTLAQSLTITVVNQAPVLNGTSINALAGINEDPAANGGTLVSQLIAGKVTDSEAVLGIAVVGADNSKGTWQYTTNGGSSWQDLGNPSDTSARLLAADTLTFVRFVPNANWNGSATITVRAWDQSSGTAGGSADTSGSGSSGAFSSTTATSAITVAAVNDPPVRTGGSVANVTVLTGTSTSLGLSGLAYGPGGGGFETSQTLSFTVTAVPSATLGQVKLANGTVVSANTAYQLADLQGMVFVPGAGVTSGSGTFSFTVKDSGGTANGGVDSLAQSLTITIAQTAPTLSGSDNPAAIKEDSGNATFRVSDLLGSHVSDPDVGAQTGIAITAVDNSHGQWQYSFKNDGTGWTDISGVSETSALLLTSNNQGRLRFVPDANYFGATTITFRAWDRTSGTEGSKVDVSVNGDPTAFSAQTATSTLTILPVNDAPVRTAGTVSDLSVLENSGATSLNLGSLAYDHGGGVYENGQVLSYRVTAVPSALGDILLADGSVVSANTTYQLSDLQGMRFRAGANATGGPATFTWVVKDDGGTANGGVDSLTQTINITIANTNQAPVLSGANPLADILEDATGNNGTLVSAILSGKVSDRNVNPLYGLAVTAVDESLGRWQYSLDNGTSWSSLTGASDSQARLLAADAQTRVRFVPATPDFNGPVAPGLSFRAWDQSSGTNGSLANTGSNGGSTAFSTAIAVAGLNVTAVNDPPVLTGGTFSDLSVLENSGTTSLNLGSLAYGAGGGSDESSQNLSVIVTALPSGLGDIVLANGSTVVTAGGVYSIADLQGMQFRAGANATGGPQVFSWKVQDDGGTLNGGNDSLAQSLAVRIANTNQAPVLSGANALGDIAEDASGNNGTLVSALLAGKVTDRNVNPLSGLAVTAVDESHGLWQYSVDGGSSWTSLAGTSDSAARLLAADALTRVRFVPASDWNGTVNAGLTFRAWDQSSGTSGSLADTRVNGGSTAFSLASASTSVKVNAVNDAPVRSAGSASPLTVLENSGTTSLGLGGLVYGPGGGSDETTQNLGITVTALPSALGDIVLADGTTVVTVNTVYTLDDLRGMQFRAGTNASGGPLAFGWRVQDDGGTTAGGVDTLAEAIDIQIATVNQAPVLAGANNLGDIAEDATSNNGTLVSALVAGKVSDGNANAATGIAVTALDESHGRWQFSRDGGGNWWSIGSVSDTAARLLAADALTRVRFVPDADWSGTVTAGLSFRAWDRTSGVPGATADTSGANNGGAAAFSTAIRSSNIAVTPVNDAPVRSAGTVADLTVLENADTISLNLGALLYGPGGASDENTQQLTITVTGVPSGLGDIVLANGSTVVTAGGVYSLADLQGMQFRAGWNATGGPQAFSWRVQDDGGTAGGGADTLDESLQVRIANTNQAPMLAGANPLGDIAEDATGNNGSLVSDLLTGQVSDRNVVALAGIAVTGVDSTQGRWEYSADGGAHWSNLAGVSDTSARLLAADAQTRVRFVPAADFNGSVPAGLSFRAWDRSSGNAGDLVDTSGSLNGGSTAFSTATRSAAITVTPVNDAPVRTGGTAADLTVLENAGATPLNLGSLAYGAGGASDENTQQLTITVTGVPSGLGDIVLADGTTVVTAGDVYSLADLQGMQFRAGLNATGGPQAFSWRVQDDGGTAAGGADTLDESVQVRIANTNQAPVLTGANPLQDIAEDAVGNNGTLVSDLLAGQVTDRNVGALAGIAVTGIDTTKGRWEYSADGGANWADLAGVSDSSARLLAADTQTRVRLLPSADWNGSVPAGFSFRAWDHTSGNAGDLVDTSGTRNGGSTAFSAATRSSAITVTAVNDPPVAAPGSPDHLTVNEDSGSTALGLSYAPGGGSDETGQVLSYTVSVLPQASLGRIVLANGSAVLQGGVYDSTQLQGMRFETAPNANGSAMFEFTVTDDGGGSDSRQESIAITVSPVDDPTISLPMAVTTAEDQVARGNVLSNDIDIDSALSVASFQVAGDATVYAAGQAASLATIGSVSIDANGDFLFTPAPDWFGAVPVLTYTTNTGASATLTITVTPVDDPTAANPDSKTVAEDTTASGNVLANDTDIDSLLGVASFRVAGDNTTYLAGATVALAGMGSFTLAANGSYSFAPAANWNGAVPQVTYTTNTGASSTLAITLTPVDDPTIVQADTGSALEEGVASGTVLGNDSDPDGPLSVASFQVAGDSTVYLAGESASIAGIGRVVLGASGSYTFTPATDWAGSAPAITYTTDTGATSTLQLAITPVNDAPARLGPLDDVSVTEGSGANSLGLAGLGYTPGGGADEGGQSLGFQVTQLPAAALGRIVLADGSDAVLGTLYTLDDLRAMKFVTGTSASGSGVFGFEVIDNGGNANGGSDRIGQSLTITVVNRAPSLAGSNDLPDLLEDAGLASNGGLRVADLVSGHLSDPLNAGGIAVVGASSANGTWQYTLDGGSTWSDFGAASSTNATLLGVDAATRVRFVANGNWFGTDSGLMLRAWDQTTGAIGQIDADTSVNGASTAFSTAIASASVTVKPVNDVPLSTGTAPADQATVEGATISLGLAGVNYAAGPANESAQNLSYTITGLPSALGTVTLADGTVVVQGQSYNLADLRGMQFTAAGGASGTAAFSFSVSDDGGTADGGIDALAQGLQVTVGNQAPVLTGPLALPNIAEDASGNAGVLVSDLVNGHISDPTPNRGVAVVGASSANGSWQFSRDDGVSWSALTGASASNATLLKADAVTRVRFVPDADWNGTASGLDLRAWDQTGGTASLLVADTTVAGSTAYGTQTVTASVVVDPVDDASVLASDTGAADEDHPATGDVLLNDTDIDSTLQVASFRIAGDGNTYTAGQGATILGVGSFTLAANGSYSFDPAANWNGTAPLVTYTTNTGASSTLQVTIRAVADPTTVVADTITVDEDHTASGNVLLNDADPDAPLQVASFQVAGDTATYNAGDSATVANVGTFTLAANGGYSFAPVANWNGTAPVLTYTTDTGASSTLQVTVRAVDDPTTVVADTNTVDEDNTATGNVLLNDSDVDAPLQVATFTVAGDTATYTAGQSASIANVGTFTLAANGGYSFAPVANWNGAAPVLTYTTDTGASSTLQVTVRAVDDPTTVVADTNTVDEDNTATGNVLQNDSDVDGPLQVASFKVAGDTTAYTAGQSATIANIGTFTLAANGSYTFTPVANWNGAAPLLTYTTDTGASSTLQVTLRAVDDPSTLSADTNRVDEDSTATGNVLQNDRDVDNALAVASFKVAGDTTTYTAGQTAMLAGVGSFTLAADGSYSFAPLHDWNGSVPVVSYTTNTAATATLSVTVDAVNDAPVRTSGPAADVSVVEGATASLGLSSLAYSPGGGADEATQSIRITATTLPDASLGRVLLADGSVVTAGTSYSLAQWQGAQFAPAAGVNSGSALLQFSASDGFAALAPEGLRISVVNQAPQLAGANPMPDLNEDASVNAGMSVADLIAGQASDVGGVRGIAVVSARSADGDWQFSRDGGTSWSSLAGASDTQAQLLAADGLARIRFVPHADWNGNAGGLLFRAWDGSGGSGNLLAADAGNAGGSSAFSGNAATASVRVLPVNDAPVPLATGPASTTLDPDIGASALPLASWNFAAGGGSDEGSQALSVTFTAAPAQLGSLLRADGTAVHAGDTLTLAQFQSLRLLPAGGSASGDLQWIVRDDGGTARGGVDQLAGSLHVAVAPSAALPPAPPAPAPAPAPSAPPPAAPAPAPAPVPATAPAPAPAPAAAQRPADAPKDSIEQALAPAAPALAPQPGEGGAGFSTERRLDAAEARQPAFIRTLQDRGEIQLVGYTTPADFQVLGFSRAERGAARGAGEDLRQMLRSTAFVNELNHFREQLRQEFNLDRTTSITVAGLSLGVSVVYVLWLIRGGVLLGSYLSALPAWQLLDPLPVLARSGDDEEDEDEEPLQQARVPADPLRGFA